MTTQYKLLQEIKTQNLKKNDIVYHYTGPTYGCCSPSEIPCTLDSTGDGTPFFGIQATALEPIEKDI